MLLLDRREIVPNSPRRIISSIYIIANVSRMNNLYLNYIIHYYRKCVRNFLQNDIPSWNIRQNRLRNSLLISCQEYFYGQRTDAF